MLYKVTFFKRTISIDDWFNFFQNIVAVCGKIKVSILVSSSKIDFFLKSNKNLDLINNRLFPFHLTNEVTKDEKELIFKQVSKKKLALKIINQSLFQLIEDDKINGL